MSHWNDHGELADGPLIRMAEPAASYYRARDALDKAKEIAEEVAWLLGAGQSPETIAQTLGYTRTVVLNNLRTSGDTVTTEKWRQRIAQGAAEMATYQDKHHGSHR